MLFSSQNSFFPGSSFDLQNTLRRKSNFQIIISLETENVEQNVHALSGNSRDRMSNMVCALSSGLAQSTQRKAESYAINMAALDE